MKKQILLAFTAALGITLSVSAPVEAASANRVNISVFEKDCAADQWNSFEADSVNDLLKKICDRFPAIVLPGECTPEIPEDDKDDQTPGTPEKPDTPEKPEENQPGGNTSGDEQPRPDGRTFGTAITDLGITYRGAGENIAWGQKTPETVMNAWMNSEGHRANILNPNFKKLGVGYRTNGQGTPYWTQLFTY